MITKLNFFTVTWSFRNHSNLIIWCSRNIPYYYYQCWKEFCCQIFLWKLWYIYYHKKVWKITLMTFKLSLNWSNVTVKTFIMLQNNNISNKCCTFELSIHQRILEKYHGFHKDIKQHNCFLKVQVTLKTDVMAAENSALQSQRKKKHFKYIKIQNISFKL